MTNLTAAAALAVSNLSPGNKLYKLGERVRANAHAGKRFHVVATLVAIAAGTPVELLPAADVDSGEKIYLEGCLLSVGGTTAWTDTTATIVTVDDLADTPVVALSFAKAQLTSEAQLGFHIAGLTLIASVRTGVGLTGGLTLQGDANFTAGDDITIQVWGQIK